LEYDWLFDVKPDLSIDISAIVTIHPSGTWSSDSLTWTLGTLSNFAAYDVSTGSSLALSTTTTTSGGTTYTVSFPTDESDGYRFRVQFHVMGLASQISSGFTIGFGWGGGNESPQKVRVELPAGYNIASVVNTDTSAALTYAPSWDGTRVLVDFQGTAPTNGYFDWKLQAHGL
jgi:hypothetical protein